MDKFTASNGISVKLDGHLLFGASTHATYVAASESQVQALREFFQAERDEELGRWRWPENPDYVVYPAADDADLITVMRESVARIRKMRREGFGLTDYAEQFVACAEAYFEAHPERKDWEDAKEGEVWIVTPSKALTLGEKAEYPAIFQAGMFRDHGGSWGTEDLTAAHRIWPEVP